CTARSRSDSSGTRRRSRAGPSTRPRASGCAVAAPTRRRPSTPRASSATSARSPRSRGDVRLTLGVPTWGLLLLAAAVLGLAALAYRRTPLSATQRAVLAGLRALGLGLVAFCLLGPVVRAR